MSNQEEAKKGSCPGCGGELREVYAEAHYGRYLSLDQCQDCGGIWFDRWELYYLKEDEANRLDLVDKGRLLSHLTFRKGAGLCPACEIDLKPFHDLNLPEDANIERCPQCSGLWLNRGELRRYEDHKRLLKEGQKGDIRPSDQLPKPTPNAYNKRLEDLQSLGKAISVRITPETQDPAGLDETEIEGKELAKDLVFIIVQILLRLFLKI